MKKLTVCIYINIVLSVLFSILSLSFHADISLLAFPLAAVFTAILFYSGNIQLLKKSNLRHLTAIRRVFQYEPFVFISAFVIQRSGNSGMPFALDIMCALVWTVTMLISFYIQHILSEKRIVSLNEEWGALVQNFPKSSLHGAAAVLREILEWVDALIQAVFTIILLNIFLFQLYEIPSESMVPTFLVKDRVVVFKTLAGPKFPLSQAGIPYIQDYKRGDIVVFRNPHYGNDRKSEVKTFFSQFIYMCSLTLLKTNTDENGEIKADPLVKRIVGTEGEQLVMLDGNLYSRTRANPEFKVVEDDKKWAAWNLNGLSSETKNKIEWIPMSESDYDSTLYIESERRALDLKSAAAECERLSAQFASFAKGGIVSAEIAAGLLNSADLFIYNLFSSVNTHALNLLTVDGGAQWFDMFMNGWHKNSSVLDASLVGGDMYSDACFRLNVMAKLAFGRIVVETARLVESGASSSEVAASPVRMEQLVFAQALNDYILRMDQRNMPVFPPNNSDGTMAVILAKSYMMMGDNRYNSLDMRHSYKQALVNVTAYDPLSIRYYSNMAPQYVERDRILGKASFRFWPLNRIGIPDSRK